MYTKQPKKFQKSSDGQSVDYKARLEHKLYLARETPEPIFDISECALKNVPSGIYSLCKVFRKRTLLLQCNRLSSLLGGGALRDLYLLTVLNLSCNELSSLPSDIQHLVSLKELYLQENKIRKLPEEIVRLIQLNILDVSANNLKCLPETMGNLVQLTTLILSNNKLLQMLPKSIGQAQQIQILEIDGLNLLYPPKDVLDGGATVIIAFLAHECGIGYSPETYVIEPEEDNCTTKDAWKTTSRVDTDIQATLQRLEKTKERRQNALLQVEENIKHQQEFEAQLQSILKIHKKKLLEDLAVQQAELKQELEKVQQERDVNRTRLLTFIYDAEKAADNVIKEFLHSSEEARQSQAELFERETQEEMQLLSRSHSEQFLYRTKDTLLAMEELLEQELLKEKILAEYTEFRNATAQTLLSLEVRNNEQLLQVMQDHEKNRQDLVNRLRKDEDLQRAMVATFLERSDARSWSIVQQVNLVQSQLAVLTNIELERRKVEINQQINDLAERRMTLSAILLNLLEQQEMRREQLLDTISHIEAQRDSNKLRRDSLFWLHQYQSLMETRPQGFLETLEPALVCHMATTGVLHCLPFLSALPPLLPNISGEQLREMGIKSQGDRDAILLAVENYTAENKINTHEPITPSAPTDEPCTSSKNPCAITESAPPQHLIQIECIVCMDSECEVIFLPCGHLCCCPGCADMITTLCPMCRSEIQHKIRVVKP